MPELQRRLIKLLSARQRRIPACVARSRFWGAWIRQLPLSNQLQGILWPAPAPWPSHRLWSGHFSFPSRSCSG